MDLQFKKWIIGLSYALVVLALPAMSQDQTQPDSLPVMKELVIATINASQPDSVSKAIPKTDLNIISSPVIIKKERQDKND